MAWIVLIVQIYSFSIIVLLLWTMMLLTTPLLLLNLKDRKEITALQTMKKRTR